MEMVNKGKKLVIGLIVIVLLINIVSIAFVSSIYAVSGRMDLASYKLLQGIFRFILEVLLLFFMYKGHRWAKWLFVMLFMLAGIMALLGLISEFNLIVLVLGLVYVCFGVMMIFSRSVKTFFLYQRGLYHSSPDEGISIHDYNSTNVQE